MKPTTTVSNDVKQIVVERKPFEDAMRKLLKAPPTSKQAIARKIERAGRNRPLTRPLGER